MNNRISTKMLYEELNHDTARLVIELYVDGEPCGRIEFLSGPKADIKSFMEGEKLQDISTRWAERMKRRNLAAVRRKIT